jgi:predicted O-methyltransferase YrrM
MTGALAAVNLHEFAVEWVDCAPHYPTLITLAREATTVVEFGVRGGVSTWALLDGLPEDGRLYSVDIDNCVVPPRVSGDPRWTFLVGDDLDPAIQAQLPERADLIFIDTSHEYDQTVAELTYALTFEPARIALHDYELDAVRRAVDEFCVAQGWHVATRERSQWGFVVLEP